MQHVTLQMKECVLLFSISVAVLIQPTVCFYFLEHVSFDKRVHIIGKFLTCVIKDHRKSRNKKNDPAGAERFTHKMVSRPYDN